MALVFVSEEHAEKFNEVAKDISSKSTKVSIYLLTAVASVREQIQEVYWKGYIDFDLLEQIHLSDGERIIVALALNLYNGYEMEGVSLAPTDLFGYVDDSFKEVILSALSHRFTKVA